MTGAYAPRLWALFARLGTPRRQLISQSGGEGPAHDIEWRCGCAAAGLPERVAWHPCPIHLTAGMLRA